MVAATACFLSLSWSTQLGITVYSTVAYACRPTGRMRERGKDMAEADPPLVESRSQEACDHKLFPFSFPFQFYLQKDFIYIHTS